MIFSLISRVSMVGFPINQPSISCNSYSLNPIFCEKSLFLQVKSQCPIIFLGNILCSHDFGHFNQHFSHEFCWWNPYLEVSWNSGTLKPSIENRIFPSKPTILGYPRFRKSSFSREKPTFHDRREREMAAWGTPRDGIAWHVSSKWCHAGDFSVKGHGLYPLEN